MDWVYLTEQDFSSCLNSRERETYAKFLADNDVEDGDRLPDTLEQVVQEVRTAIATCNQNKLSADDHKIPAAFVRHALAIVRYSIFSSMPRVTVSKGRTKQFDNAEKYFEKVASCEIRPLPPSDAVQNTTPTEKPSAAAQVVSSRKHITGRKNLSGL